MSLSPILESWKMSFQSVHYLLFLPVVVLAYFVLPGRLRKPWLLVASYYFYFFAAPKYLLVLISATLFSYLAAFAIQRAKVQAAKRGWLVFGLLGLLLLLAFFKYNSWFARFLSPFFAGLGIDYDGGYFVMAGAVGISFYTFTALAYLIDLYRGDVPFEKSLFTHALFMGFFATVTLGPIARAGDLLPQLNDTSRKFDAQNAADALRLMAVGFFKKLAVADTLVVFVDGVFGALDQYTGFTYGLAAVVFALQLYFDFSGYSDIVRGSAALLGIRLPPNFNTPYFSTNFSGFWQRWHISFSSWLQDYIFTPLVWSRWTEKIPFIGKYFAKPPVLSSLVIVFLVSGVWHGDTACFLVWGALQALYRVGEELLHRRVGKPRKNPPFWLRTGKILVVFVLWVESLLFFRVGRLEHGSVSSALSVLVNQFRGFSLAQTGRDIYEILSAYLLGKPVLVVLFIIFTVFCLGLALWADWAQHFRFKSDSIVIGMKQLRAPVRYGAYLLLVLGCFAAFLIQNGGFAGASFAYGGF